jgi:phosphopantetheinyl transferase
VGLAPKTLTCALVSAALEEPAARAALFMALWTAKEAVVKAKDTFYTC